MMAEGQPQELEQLERGLQGARPLNDLIEQLTRQNGAKELYDRGTYYVRWTGQMMAVAGIYFLALKEKVGHGPFKKFFSGKDRPVSYMHAWQCMKAAHVVAEHPAFGELRSSHPFRSLLMLPAPERAAIAEQLKHIPDEQVQQLLPDIIKERYDELRDERRKARPSKKKKLSNEKAQAFTRELEAERAEPGWNEIYDAWMKCLAAMGRLAAVLKRVEIRAEWYDRIFDRQMLERLGDHYEVIWPKMHPPEEVRKRAEIKHVKGFGSKLR